MCVSISLVPLGLGSFEIILHMFILLPWILRCALLAWIYLGRLFYYTLLDSASGLRWVDWDSWLLGYKATCHLALMDA